MKLLINEKRLKSDRNISIIQARKSSTEYGIFIFFDNIFVAIDIINKNIIAQNVPINASIIKIILIIKNMNI